MTGADALRLLRAVLKAHGVAEAELDAPEMTVSTGDVDLELAFVEGRLRCRAELHRFLVAPDPALPSRIGAPNIGTLVVDGDQLFLEKSYARSLPITRLLSELEAVVEEARDWISDRLIREIAG